MLMPMMSCVMTEFKKEHGKSVLLDWQRLIVLQQLCDQLENIITPTALRIEIPTSAIIYEHWNFPVTLISLIDSPDIYGLIGRALAQLQNVPVDLELDSFSSESYPLQQLGIKYKDADIMNSYISTGWFHGDFWHGNTFVLPDNQVIVIDPLPNPTMFTPKYIRASGGLDAAFMYMSIIFCLPLREQITMKIHQHIHAAESFLEGYLYEKNISCPHLKKSIRCTSRTLALRFIEGYSYRLSYPISVAKKLASKRILQATDQKINWKNK